MNSKDTPAQPRNWTEPTLSQMSFTDLLDEYIDLRVERGWTRKQSDRAHELKAELNRRNPSEEIE